MIHTRGQLITWIGEHIDDPVLLRGLQDGEVECLGGFAPLPTSQNSGWLVKITTKYRTRYLIAVAADRKHFGRIYWFRAPRVEWVNWIGDTTTNPLFTGDRPDDYRERKSVSLDRRDSGSHSPQDGDDSEARTGSRLDRIGGNQDVQEAGA